MKREIGYQWRLAELMARHGMHNSTDLAPLLRERGIDLSPSQVYRIVTQRPERVSLILLSALADIFTCTLDDLVTFTATDARRPARRAAAAKNVVQLGETVRPVRARIVDEH